MRNLGNRIEVTGAMNMDATAGLRAEGVAYVKRFTAVFDLFGVTEITFSGRAVAFGWQRVVKRVNKMVPKEIPLEG